MGATQSKQGFLNINKMQNNQTYTTIPKNIYMTTHIPLEYVPDLIGDKAKDYKIFVYNDKSARDYLKEYWGTYILQHFDRLKKGAHRMDLWRYCILYTHGGVYFDIKTSPLVDINKIFSSTNTWYTCISFVKGFYQGIIATPKANNILLDCIRHITRTNNKTLKLKYHAFTLHMKNICKPIYNSNLDSAGFYLSKYNKNLYDLVLFQEKNFKHLNEPRDHRGHNSYILDRNGNKLFKTRDSDYPWKSLPINKISILEKKNVSFV